MKRYSRLAAAAVFVSVLAWAGAGLAADAGTLTIVTSKVDLAKEDKVVFKGTGFAAGQEVYILINDADGVQTDIGYALDPEPKADDKGQWETTWDAKRFIDKKLIQAGDYTVTVTDMEYAPIDSGSMNFFGKPVKKKKEE